MPEPHDSRYCGARKRQPAHPGERCRRPAGWGTEHPGWGRCKLHGGSTPYRHGRYSRVVRELYLPDVKWKLRRYSIGTLRTILTLMIPDQLRSEKLFLTILHESGLLPQDEEDRDAVP